MTAFPKFRDAFVVLTLRLLVWFSEANNDSRT